MGLCLSLALAACTPKYEPPPFETNNGSTNNGETTPGGIGDACDGDADCQENLVCADDSTCQAAGDFAEGAPCTRTAECADGLYCEQTLAACATAGTGAEGDICTMTGDCTAGLVCTLQGLNGLCSQPGTVDVGGECEGPGDCLAGLGCVPPSDDPEGAAVCQAGPAGLPIWRPPADRCAPDEEGNFRSFFEIPDGEVSEFYRLPYPNDIRLKDGHPDLSGHFTPGAALLGFDVTQRYIDAVERSQDRFSPNTWAFMRFSEGIDFDSVAVGGDDPSLYVVVLDPDHPRFGSRVSLRWKANSAEGNYICQNWLAVRPGGPWGKPLDSDTTYGIIMTTNVKSKGGVRAKADADLELMLADSKPSGVKGDAWDAYQPLRDWIAAESVDASAIAQAIVYTTGDPLAEARALAAPARAETPTVSDLTVCADGVTSPCDDGLDEAERVRGCFGATDRFAEIHGKISLPIFQEGDAPYLDSGGAVTPNVVRREDVCMAMTVPNAEMPAEGWPVVVYAHGTNGSFRGHTVNGTMDILQSVTVGGEEVQFLTIGWDQVMHHTRRNGDDTHPNNLVFNYANPAAAKGNFLQAAADTHAVLAYVESLDIAAADSPTGSAIKANPDQIYFIGHSQGGTSGPLALPFDSTTKGAVLSGAGAGLMLAILGKTTPVDSPAAVQAALLERKVPTETHPVLNIIQAYFDPVDPVNFGRFMTSEIIDQVTTPKHVFHTNSPTDTYSPPAGLDAMARALDATYLLPVPGEVEGVPTASAPFGGNIEHDEVPYSSLGRQYESDGTYDGHFVMFRNEDASGDVAEFLGSAIETGVPTVE